MHAAERNLLFGLVALQNGLINQGQLVAGFQAWTLDKSRIPADHLEVNGNIDSDDRRAVEALMARHLKRHGGDAEKSLAAVLAGASTRESLARIGDPEIDRTLDHVGSASDVTLDHDADRTPDSVLTTPCGSSAAIAWPGPSPASTPTRR